MGAENFSMTNTIRKDLESYNKNEVARPRFLLVIISSILIIQCASQKADKLLSEVVGKEFVDAHDGGIILFGEPLFGDALFLAPYVATVSTWYLLAGAEVLPQAIFEEALRECCFYEATIGADCD